MYTYTDICVYSSCMHTHVLSLHLIHMVMTSIHARIDFMQAHICTLSTPYTHVYTRCPKCVNAVSLQVMKSIHMCMKSIYVRIPFMHTHMYSPDVCYTRVIFRKRAL